MAFNPSKSGNPIEAPTQSRKNSVNDPGYENRVGYFPYDLSHTEVLSPLYGMVTPSMHFITAMGDRHVVKDDCKTILNKIDGNFLNTVNQYVDSFFVSNRTMFPNNWDKLIPNPVKGDDLPNSARPVVPLLAFLFRLISSEDDRISIIAPGGGTDVQYQVTPYGAMESLIQFWQDGQEIENINNFNSNFGYAVNNLLYAATIMSRGQLLDYLGIQFDNSTTDNYLESLQWKIDDFMMKYWSFVADNYVPLVDVNITPTSLGYSYSNVSVITADSTIPKTLSEFRDRVFSALEAGKLIIPNLEVGFEFGRDTSFGEFVQSAIDLYNTILYVVESSEESIERVNTSDHFNQYGNYYNLSKVLAYQLSIAQFYTKDSVDNIFTSDLYMQLLRGIMYPSFDNVTYEPTFDYNGVPTEYDYLSYGGFYSSLISPTGENMQNTIIARRYLFASTVLMLRRSLRYGDYFTSGRTRMLAVGQLSVPVNEDDGMSVNPVDITLGLVTQRFLNAANRVGNKPLEYYASIMGVTPSDMPSAPRYVGHRKIELENRVTTNTANNQGEQTTNLVGFSDKYGFDVFIDDYGVLLSLVSFDCLPIYHSGVDADNFLSDRFEYFNPMMQNIGDQPIRASELLGNTISNYRKTFAYTVRNAEYKYKNSRAHGVLCYNLPGFLLKFPTQQFSNFVNGEDIDHINPDFIRDKPAMLDSVIEFTTGASFGDYYHFIVSIHNFVKSARLIQRAPGILF